MPLKQCFRNSSS